MQDTFLTAEINENMQIAVKLGRVVCVLEERESN